MSQTMIINGLEYNYFDLKALDASKVNRMPYSHKILLENALRHAELNDNNDVETILNWDPNSNSSDEISFTPSRVILQDFTGVPAVVDLAAMRNAVKSRTISILKMGARIV